MARPSWKRVTATIGLVLLFVFSAASLALEHPPVVAPASGASAASAGSSASELGPQATPTEQSSFERAETSLAAGEGPAAGVSLTCQSAASLSARCTSGGARQPTLASEVHTSASATVESHHPAPAKLTPSMVQPDLVASTTLNWTNQSGAMDGTFQEVPGNVAGGALAYDPAFEETVFFGGGGGASNNLWTYDGVGWENWTFLYEYFGELPMPVYFPTLTWDPAFQGLVMTAGALDNGYANHATWVFNASGFLNVTDEIGLAPAAVFASVAWDPVFYSLIVVNGCPNDGCSSYFDQTWFLYGDFGWYNETTYFQDQSEGGGPNFGFFLGEMAYDPIIHSLVAFGGRYTSGSGFLATNATWIFNATGWFNVTTTSKGEFCIFICVGLYPDYAWEGSMTWDGQLDAIVLIGGVNATGYLGNTTWVFVGDGYWYPAWLYFNINIAEPQPIAGAAMDTNSSQVAPLMLGGICFTAYCYNNSYVLEIPPEVSSVTITPSSVDTNSTAYVTATVVPGTGSGPWFNTTLADFYTNLVYQYSPFVNFTTSWSFSATFSFANYPVGVDIALGFARDWYGVGGYNYTLFSVNASVVAAPFGTPNPAEVGVPVSFDSGAALGVGPYTYLWRFGDHTAGSTLAEPSHTYETSGTFDGWVVVTDSQDQSVNASYSVTVAPHVTAAPTVSEPYTEVGLPVTLTANAADGVGSYGYEWHFGDHTAPSTSENPAHTYAAAGTYKGWVVVTDGLGATANESFTVVVNATLSATPTYAPSATEVGVVTTFSSGAAAGVPKYTYLWYPGTGASTFTSANPTFTYATVGTYTASVKVTDRLGISVNETVSVVVDPALTVDAIHASTLTPNTATSVTFSVYAGNGTGGYTYAWNLGGVSTSTDPKPSYTFGSANTYTITVTVKDSAGASIEKSLSLTVTKAPSTGIGAFLTTSPGIYILVAVIIILVAAVLGALLMRKKGGSSQNSSPADAQGSPSTTTGTGGGGSPPPGASQ